jgi:hypothetical protein
MELHWIITVQLTDGRGGVLTWTRYGVQGTRPGETRGEAYHAIFQNVTDAICEKFPHLQGKQAAVLFFSLEPNHFAA